MQKKYLYVNISYLFRRVITDHGVIIYISVVQYICFVYTTPKTNNLSFDTDTLLKHPRNPELRSNEYNLVIISVMRLKFPVKTFKFLEKLWYNPIILPLYIFLLVKNDFLNSQQKISDHLSISLDLYKYIFVTLNFYFKTNEDTNSNVLHRQLKRNNSSNHTSFWMITLVWIRNIRFY